MILGMSKDEFRRAAGMWGIAMCVLASAAGWMFMRFGMAWSLGDLPHSSNIDYIVPAYIVAEVAMIPFAGKLTDRIGAKKVLAFAPFVYIIGSMLCMVSVTVEMAIITRVIQGTGAGLVLGMAFSAVGKYYAPDKRGKCHELMTAAFAFGSLFGTATGYFLADHFGWRSGFIFLSVTMLAGFLLAWWTLPEHEVSDRNTDMVGMVLAAAVYGLAALYTQLVNVDIDLISFQSLAFVLVIIASVVLLLMHCSKSSDPIIAVNLPPFEKKMIFLMFMFSLCGLGLIQYFFKLYLTYYEFDIYKASSMFIVMIAGAAITSMIGGKFVFRTGAMPWILVGSSIVTVGLMLTNLIADKSILGLAISLFVFGMGLGCIVTEILCSLQTVFPWEHMGQHTGNLMAIRMMGILTGNAVVGAYISNIVDAGKDHTPIEISATDNLIDSIITFVSDGVHTVAESLDTGFMMTVIIMAMATTFLTAVAHTLGRPDAEAVKRYNEAHPEEEKEQDPSEE